MTLRIAKPRIATPRIAPLAGAGLLALASLNAWSLSSLIAEILDDDQPAVAKVEWRPQLMTSADDSGGQKRIEDYPEILAHPIFFKTREPFVPPPPPAPPKVAQPAPTAPVDPGLILGGVMTTGRLRKAYLLTKTNPAGSWVIEGDSFMGWIIKSVDSASAKVQQQDRTIELQLYPQDQTASSPPSGSPPPSSPPATESPRAVMPRVGPPAVIVGPPALRP
jgi:hypothetical protein